MGLTAAAIGTALTLAAVPGQASAAILSSFDLEYASTSGATLTDNGHTFALLRTGGGGYPTISTAVPADSGTHSLRAAVGAGTGYSRSEVLAQPEVPNTGRHAYAFSIYVPADHQPPRGEQWELFSQMWQTACGSPAVAFGVVPNTDPLQYRVLVRNDQTTEKPTAVPRTIGKGALPRGQWVQFAMEFNASPANPANSYFDLYVDGQKTAAKLPAGEGIGYTKVASDCQYPNRSSLDLRVGIYRGGATWDTTQALHFDDMRYGDTISDVMR